MTRLLNLLHKDSAITAALWASLLTLIFLAGIQYERAYLLDLPDSVRAVGAEDDCAYGTKDVRRFDGVLYCIGEP